MREFKTNERESEPELFSKPNASQWFELSRNAIKAQTALVPVSKENNISTTTTNSLTSDDCLPEQQPITDKAKPSLHALVNDVEFIIPECCS